MGPVLRVADDKISTGRDTRGKNRHMPRLAAASRSAATFRTLGEMDVQIAGKCCLSASRQSIPVTRGHREPYDRP